MLRTASSLLHDFKNVSAERISGSIPDIVVFYEYMRDVAVQRCKADLWPASYGQQIQESYSAIGQLVTQFALKSHSNLDAIRKQLLGDHQGDIGRMANECVWPWSRTRTISPFVAVMVQVSRILFYDGKDLDSGYEFRLKARGNDLITIDKFFPDRKSYFALPFRLPKSSFLVQLLNCVIVITPSIAKQLVSRDC
jgi:hypothetical protein